MKWTLVYLLLLINICLIASYKGRSGKKSHSKHKRRHRKMNKVDTKEYDIQFFFYFK